MTNIFAACLFLFGAHLMAIGELNGQTNTNSIVIVADTYNFSNVYWYSYTTNVINPKEVVKVYDVVTDVKTNWETVSVTYPVIKEEDVVDLVYRYKTENQEGTVFSNTYLLVFWKGNEKRLLVESVPFEKVERKILK